MSSPPDATICWARSADRTPYARPVVSNRVVLRNRSFQRLFVSRAISNVGNGMAPIALAFGILDLPGTTPASLSLVLAAQAVMGVLLLPVGGVVADRLGRARVISITDITLSVVILFEAALFITGTATIPVLVGIAMVCGALNALWWPAYPGLVPDVVPEEHLQPANGLMSVASNGGLIIGATIGGALVALVGSGWAIAVDGLSFLVAGLLVFSIRHLSTGVDSGESVVDDLVHGWRVFISYRWVVVVVAAFSVIVMVWRGAEEVMGPVLAREAYGGPAGWAVVTGAQAVGLLVGALFATKIRIQRPLVFGMLVMFALPLWLLLLALRAPLPVVAGGSLLFGIALELFSVLWFTAMQQHIPREALSRVSSYDAFGSLMFGPIGLAVAGPFIVAVGSGEAFLISAVITATAIAVSFCFPSLRALRSRNTAVISD